MLSAGQNTVSTIRRVLVSSLLAASVVAGLIAVPATPASAACSFDTQVLAPYRSGSTVRSKVNIGVSCKGQITIYHWVNRDGRSAGGWETFRSGPYHATLDRSTGACQSGKYQAFLSVRFSGPNGMEWESREASRVVSFKC